jgi:hypothetical protein
MIPAQEMSVVQQANMLIAKNPTANFPPAALRYMRKVKVKVAQRQCGATPFDIDDLVDAHIRRTAAAKAATT